MRQLGSWPSKNGPVFSVEFKDLDEQLRYLRRMISGPKVNVGGELLGDYRTHPDIRDLAISIIRKADVTPRDRKSQALAIGQWVQDNIMYVLESPERFATPIRTLKDRAGDCDDQVQLIGSLIQSIGIPDQLVCMQIDGVWRHIFDAAVMPSGALLPLDSTMRDFSVQEAVNPTAWAIQRGKRVRIKLA